MQAALIPVVALLMAEPGGRPADAHVIAVSVAPEQTCPAARQVTDALAARLPGAVLPPGGPARPGVLRLTVGTDGAAGIRIDLADPEGAPLLHRALTATRGPAECAALADTIALIIERYWREVGYDAPPLAPPAPPPPPPTPPPPPPPPPAAAPPEPRVEPEATAPAAVESRRAEPRPDEGAASAVSLRWSVAAAIAGRAGTGDVRDGAALLALAVEGRVGIRLSGGVSNSSTAALDVVGQAEFRRFPLRIGTFLPIRLALGQLEPGLGLNLDLLSFGFRNDEGRTNLRSPSTCSGQLCRIPGFDVALGWSLASAHHVYVRALARAGASVSYSFVNGNGDPIWRTPSTYLEVAVESGLWFP